MILQIFDENILTDGYCLSPYTCKRCTILKQFDRLNCDGLARKCQKHQNFPPSIALPCENGKKGKTKIVERIVITEREERERNRRVTINDTIFVGTCSGHYQQ